MMMVPLVFLRNQFINGIVQLQTLLSSSWVSKLTASKQLFLKIYPLFFHKICIPIWFIIIWQCLIRILQLPNYILPTPLEVLQSLINHVALITSQTLPTLAEILLGLFFGIILGVAIALSMCLFRPLHSFLLPLLLASQALPVFAIAPLLVLWFGYSILAKIIITTFMLFFPITNNFLDGLKQTPENYLNIAEIMNSSRWQILYQIRIPAALPNLASGIRLATAMAPLGAIIGEWVGSNQGLGFLLLNANAQIQIMKLHVVCQQIMILGEGPLWHPMEKCLYWVDIVAGTLYRLNSDKTIDKFRMPTEIGSIACSAKGGLVAALSDRFATIDTITGTTQNIALPLQGIKNVMFNDGKCDRQGRFWAGTKDNAEQNPIGALYCLNKGNVTEMLNGFTVSNGIAWNLDNSLMYICDSPARQIYQYEFDSKHGNLGQMHVFAQITKEQGFPDGLTVDNQGYLWSCHWDGWQITRYTPTGEIDSVIPMPVPRPTSCCFGGPDLTTLYVTSASIGLTTTQLADAPQSGMLFAIETTGIKGLPEPCYVA